MSVVVDKIDVVCAPPASVVRPVTERVEASVVARDTVNCRERRGMRENE